MRQFSSHFPFSTIARIFLAAIGITCLGAAIAAASDFSEPWKRVDRALVVDAYEYNPIDWPKLASDRRIVGFINKASDGLSPPYRCSGNRTEIRLCKALWKRHAVARELFHTRRTVARSLGLEWGAYHLGRPGNPIDQANNFIDFAEPGPDDLIALDIEDNDSSKWMSLKDAETFARHIHTRLGRWPVLYTNGSTALHIAENRERYTVLSRLPLWYARYKPAIGLHFPKGHWQTYTLWQFAASTNCNARSCPYRVPGTPLDIDVNVASMSADELRAAWPFGGLVDDAPLAVGAMTVETVPLPVPRSNALAGGDVTVLFAPVDTREAVDAGVAIEVASAGPVDIPTAEASPTEPDEIAVATGEIVPLPIWRSEARKKRGDVTVKFVQVERMISRASARAARMRSAPFGALLGEDVGTEAPVMLAAYSQTSTETHLFSLPPEAAPDTPMLSTDISAAAFDDPDTSIPPARLARTDLPVFLLRRLDGPDDGWP